MKIFFSLIKLQLASFLDAGGTTLGGKKKRPIWLRIVFLMAICVGVSVLYGWLYLDPMISSYSYFALYMVVMLALAMTFIGGLTMAMGALYEFKDYDLLMSLPLRKELIVSAKLVSFYLLEYIYSGFVIIPTLILYGTRFMKGFSFYAYGILGTFFFPIIPMVIGSLIAFLIRRLTANAKHKTLWMNILTIAGFGTYFYLVMGVNSGADDANSILKIVNLVDSLPNLKWYLHSFLDNKALYALLHVLINVVIGTLFIFILSKQILKTNELWKSSGYHDANFQLKQTSNKGVLGALLKKELGKLFSNLTYMMNMTMGQISLVGISVYFLFSGLLSEPDIKEALAVYEIKDMIAAILAFGILTAALLTPIASVSISLEGKNLWITKSLPIDVNTVFLSKFFMNFIVAAVPSMIVAIIWGIVIPLQPIQWGVVILSVLISAAFVSLFGLVLNLLFPKLNFDREVVVIKQSLSVFIAFIMGLVIPGGIFALYLKVFVERFDSIQYAIIVLGVLAVLDVLMVIYLRTIGKRQFYQMSN